MAHIISGCNTTQGKYKLWHDKMLLALACSKLDLGAEEMEEIVYPATFIHFIREGEKPSVTRKTKTNIPPEHLRARYEGGLGKEGAVIQISPRSDVVIWSEQARKIILTAPWEGCGEAMKRNPQSTRNRSRSAGMSGGSRLKAVIDCKGFTAKCEKTDSLFIYYVCTNTSEPFESGVYE